MDEGKVRKRFFGGEAGDRRTRLSVTEEILRRPQNARELKIWRIIKKKEQEELRNTGRKIQIQQGP